MGKLVLKRRLGQTICIGDDIRVTLERMLPGGAMRLSIEAPKQVPVHREEVYDRIQRENRARDRPTEQLGKTQPNGSEGRVVVEGGAR